MPRKVYLSPPPVTRIMPLTQLILGVLFILFGAVLAAVSEGEARPFALLFVLIWSVGCIALILHAVKTLRLMKEGKIEIAEFEVSDGETESGFAARLRDLEALKNDGLISDDEYSEKRAEIVQEKW